VRGAGTTANRSSPAQVEPADPSAAWLSTGEKGTALGIRALVWVATVLGRPVGRVILRFVVAYYVVVHGEVRRHSRLWLERAHQRPVGLGEIYQHVFRFAQVTMDQLFLLRRRCLGFELERTGHEHLSEQVASGRGALLLTAHLGSPAAVGADAHEFGQSIHVAGYFRNARMINAVLHGLDPERGSRLIHIVPGSVDSVLAIQERVDAGDMVVLAADRGGVNERHHVVPFMGSPAAFPQGPFLLASLLHCPVLLVFGLYREPNRYELFCEQFSDGIDLPRAERAAAIESHVERFAQRLEHYARLAPDNWFNFYDFWRLP